MRRTPGLCSGRRQERKEPRIEIVRVSERTEAAREFQFRLSDGVVDLTRGVSLDSFDGIGDAWKTPSFTETFELALWSLVSDPRLAPALPPR